jgi:coenzyme F420-reducing hydrogenase alpha subunit
MRQNINIDVHHLTRVEGHGNIIVRVEAGELKEARWDVVETPRYFEVMLKGKHYTTAAILTSRICGICSIGHCLASLRATEDAFGVSIPEAAQKLRLLAKHGETLQSHSLHVLFLAAPDFLDLPSVVPLIETKPEVVALAARIKGLANELCDVVAGRTTHPISLQVGGVSRMPGRDSLQSLREKLELSLEDLAAVVELMKTFKIPDFSRETEFVSLKAADDYPFIGGRLMSSDGVEMDEGSYEKMSNETVNENNTSKWCSLSRESYAVGALARFNNNFHKIHVEALKAATAMGLTPTSHNPYMNNVAQIAECVHCTHDSIRIIDELLDGEPGETMTPVTPRAGRGTSAVEVPRGILYHDYTYDAHGRIVKANCVIPTTQNNANIHHDLSSLVEQFARQGSGKEELEKLCSMLVRAYDPCISCSVH